MLHAMILYHESSPDKKLNFPLARQNAIELAQAVKAIRENLKALKKESSKAELEMIGVELAGMEEENSKARDLVRMLLKELEKPQPEQAKIQKMAQKLFHIMSRILSLHKSAEEKFGIFPPTEPPRE